MITINHTFSEDEVKGLYDDFVSYVRKHIDLEDGIEVLPWEEFKNSPERLEALRDWIKNDLDTFYLFNHTDGWENLEAADFVRIVGRNPNALDGENE